MRYNESTHHLYNRTHCDTSLVTLRTLDAQIIPATSLLDSIIYDRRRVQQPPRNRKIMRFDQCSIICVILSDISPFLS